MTKTERYREALSKLEDWDSFLLEESGLPGRRANIELGRAVAAALCEPALLRDGEQVKRVLEILDHITNSIPDVEDRRSDEFKALRKGLGYCWSVAVAAAPEEGKRMMERWFSSDDKDVLWVMKENLRKKRLARMGAEWVEEGKARLGM